MFSSTTSVSKTPDAEETTRRSWSPRDTSDALSLNAEEVSLRSVTDASETEDAQEVGPRNSTKAEPGNGPVTERDLPVREVTKSSEADATKSQDARETNTTDSLVEDSDAKPERLENAEEAGPRSAEDALETSDAEEVTKRDLSPEDTGDATSEYEQYQHVLFLHRKEQNFDEDV